MEPFAWNTIELALLWSFPIILVILVSIVRAVLWLVRLRKKNFVQKNVKKVKFQRLPVKINLRARLSKLFLGNRYIFFIPIRLVIIILYAVALVGGSWYYAKTYFYGRPEVTNPNALAGELYSDESTPVVVHFNKPLNQSTIEVKTAPADFGSTVSFSSPFDDIFAFIKEKTGINLHINLYTAINILPNHSIPYDTGVIYYVTGIASLTGNGGTHEQAITFSTPTFPQSVTSSIVDQQQDVSTTDPITITFDQPITKSLSYQVSMTPEAKFTISRVGANSLQVSFDEPLQQTKRYQLQVSASSQTVTLSTGQADTTSETTQLLSTSFLTVEPPGVKKIVPEGNAVQTNSAIMITFSEPVDQKTVEDNISISPDIAHAISWVKENQIIELKPSTPLAKETQYTVILGKNAKTLKGGKLEKEFVYKFTTIGHVVVTSTSPRSGSGGISVTPALQIAFDQAVDKGSAQSKIAISPSVPVRYSWKGNTLVVIPSRSLGYSTKYSVTVKAGVKSVAGLDSTKTYTFSFTTRSQVVQIYVPSYKQNYGTFDCNIVALRMALAAKGVSASVSGIKSAIGYGTPYNNVTHTGGNPNADWIDNYGVHWDPVAQYAISRGRPAEVKRNWSLSGIASEIDRGNPVVIFWYNGLSNQTRYAWHYTYGARPGLHSVVVYGYKGSASNPTGLYVHDPWPSFYQEYYSAGQFLGKWSYFSYTAVVVK